MKTIFKTIFQSLVLIALIMAFGCKDNSKKSDPGDESQSTKIDVDSIQEEIVQGILKKNGAVIQLIIKDAGALFNSGASSIINEGNANLAYLGMRSEVGNMPNYDKVMEALSTKDFTSIVLRGNKTLWKLKMDKTNPSYKDYQEEVIQINFGEGTYGESVPCAAYDRIYRPRGNGNVVIANVKNDAIIDCQQSYSIIFSLEDKNSKEKRYFVLDPWVLVK